MSCMKGDINSGEVFNTHVYNLTNKQQWIFNRYFPWTITATKFILYESFEQMKCMNHFNAAA